jgi:hypothetical protein
VQVVYSNTASSGGHLTRIEDSVVEDETHNIEVNESPVRPAVLSHQTGRRRSVLEVDQSIGFLGKVKSLAASARHMMSSAAAAGVSYFRPSVHSGGRISHDSASSNDAESMEGVQHFVPVQRTSQRPTLNIDVRPSSTEQGGAAAVATREPESCTSDDSNAAVPAAAPPGPALTGFRVLDTSSNAPLEVSEQLQTSVPVVNLARQGAPESQQLDQSLTCSAASASASTAPASHATVHEAGVARHQRRHSLEHGRQAESTAGMGSGPQQEAPGAAAPSTSGSPPHHARSRSKVPLPGVHLKHPLDGALPTHRPPPALARAPLAAYATGTPGARARPPGLLIQPSPERGARVAPCDAAVAAAAQQAPADKGRKPPKH